jgi:glutaredoxin
LKNNVILYVKSEKIQMTQYSEAVHGHPCTGAYRATQTMRNYKPEDQKAIDLLKEAGLSHQLVNLSECSAAARLKAKLTGVNETPTLLLKGKMIKGAENISQALQ